MLRLEEKPFELEGKPYMLRCNMAVLEAVESAHDGNLEAVMTMKPVAAALEWLAAMLNDYAEEQRWPERWAARDLTRRITLAMLRELDVLGMVTRALDPGAAKAAQNINTNEETSGN